MVSLFAFASFVLHQQGSMPIQFIPKAQFAFDRKDVVLESGPGQPTEIVLVNDETVSNEVLDAIAKHKDFVQVPELFQTDASGKVTMWVPSGKVVANSPVAIPTKSVKVEPGEIYIVLELPYAGGIPKSSKDEPTIQCTVNASRAVGSFLGPNSHLYSVHKLGPTGFKYSNIRFGVQVRSYVDSFSALPGTMKSISDVGFKVVGSLPDRGDKLEHFEVIQNGYAGMDNLALIGLYDWDRYEKEVAPVRSRVEIVTGRAIKKDGVPTDVKEVHLDFPCRRPARYLSYFAVIRSSTMQGYFQHIATQPIGN